MPIEPADLANFNARKDLIAQGLLDADLADPRKHRPIIDAVNRLARTMDISPIPELVIHAGNISLNRNFVSEGWLLLSEQLQTFLSPQELDATIAHELAHFRHIATDEQVERMRVKYKRQGMSESFTFMRNWQEMLRNLFISQELNADEIAAAVPGIGAENMLNALIKTATNSSNPLTKALIMAPAPIQTGTEQNLIDQFRNATPEQIRQKIAKIMDGSEECGSVSFTARFRNLVRIRDEERENGIGHFSPSEPAPEEILKAFESRQLGR